MASPAADSRVLLGAIESSPARCHIVRPCSAQPRPRVPVALVAGGSGSNCVSLSAQPVVRSRSARGTCRVRSLSPSSSAARCSSGLGGKEAADDFPTPCLLLSPLRPLFREPGVGPAQELQSSPTVFTPPPSHPSLLQPDHLGESCSTHFQVKGLRLQVSSAGKKLTDYCS